MKKNLCMIFSMLQLYLKFPIYFIIFVACFFCAIGVKLANAQEQPTPQQQVTREELAQLKAENLSLREEIRTLVGLLEKADYDITLLNRRFDKLLADLDERLHDLSQAQTKQSLLHNNSSTLQQPHITDEAKNNNAPSLIIDEKAVEANEEVIKQAYDKAYQFVKERNFLQASQDFATFVQYYPHSTYDVQAKYWLAQSYYGLKNYVDSAKIFLGIYEKHKDFTYIRDVLYKLGLSLQKLDQTDNACMIFQEYLNQYSDNTTIEKKHIENERQSYCP